MAAQLIDGKKVSADIRESLKKEIADLKGKGSVPVWQLFL